VSAILYALEYHSLGEVEVPAKDRSCVRLDKSIVSKTIDGSLKVNVLRLTPDDEGNLEVKAMVLVRNKSDHYLPRVELRTELLSSDDDAVVEETTAQLPIDARSVTGLERGFAWLKKARFRNTKLRIGLYVYRPVHWEECSAGSTFADNGV
jgi:hypothetical protein